MTKFPNWDSYFLPEPRGPESARVLRNLIGATDVGELAAVEREVTLRRLAELEKRPLSGHFDFEHHKAIHHYIFKDVYEWAGRPRTVDMGKTHRLWPAYGIVDQARRTYGAISGEDYLRGLDQGEFVGRLAEHWGEVDVLHAFREGNTRSQRAFFGQLCDHAGYVLNGSYLEVNYTEFNKSRESAMVTGRPDGFARFLADAVHSKG